MVGLGARRDLLPCSGDKTQEDIQDPLDSVDLGNGGGGVGHAIVQSSQCSAQVLDSLGTEQGMVLAVAQGASGQRSRMGWTGGKSFVNTGPDQDCRRGHGRWDMLALPGDCKAAARLILKDRDLHSALCNATGGTSSLKGNQDIVKRPL